MERSDQALSEIITSCYQAAWDDQLWPEALANICNYLNAKSATLEAFDLQFNIPTHFYSTGINNTSADDYINYYHRVNPRNQYLLSTDEGHIGFDHQILSEKEMDRDEFYADLLRPDDLRYFLSSTLSKNKQTIVLLAPHRTDSQGHADKRDVEKMQRISPFVKQAFELGERISSLRTQRDDFFQALYNHHLGLIIIDASMSVHFINKIAQHTVRANIGLRLSSNRMAFNEPNCNNEFEKLLSRVLSPESIGAESRMLMRNKRSNQRLIIDIAPLLTPENIKDHLKLSNKHSYAIITLRDCQDKVSFSKQTLYNCYRLTPRETQIAHDILDGMSLKQICLRDKVAITTIRTHYANLRSKIGAHNRADVIRILLPLILR